MGAANYAGAFAVAGDWNGDGWVDFAGSDGNGALTRFSNGQGSLIASVISMPFDRPLVAADLNHDGKDDLFCSFGTVLLSDGAGGYQAAAAPAIGVQAVAGDLNADGKPDLIVGDEFHNPPAISILLGQ